MAEIQTKRVKSPRVADRLQREGWELVAIDRKLTVPNVFHLKREKPAPATTAIQLPAKSTKDMQWELTKLELHLKTWMKKHEEEPSKRTERKLAKISKAIARAQKKMSKA